MDGLQGIYQVYEIYGLDCEGYAHRVTKDLDLRSTELRFQRVRLGVQGFRALRVKPSSTIGLRPNASSSGVARC